MAHKFKGDIRVEGIISLPNEATSRALQIDGSGQVQPSSVTSTELGHLSGVTSSVQTQLNAKAVSATLASTANGDGASLIGIEDSAAQFTATTVEAALAEALDAAQAAQAQLDSHEDGGASKHDATEIDYERADGSKKNIQAASDEVEAALTDLDDAIGALAASPTNYTPSNAAIVADHLSAIDSQLATAAGTDFSDATFRVSDNTDSSKKIALEASAITTATVRTITMPDANVDLADIALNNAKRHDAATLNADDATQQTLNLSGQELQVNQATTSTDGAMSAEDKTKLDGIEDNAKDDQSAAEVAFTPNGDIAASNVQTAIQEVRDDTDTKVAAVEALVNGLEWQASALDYVVDNTAVPASEISGDRYILSHDGGTPHADYDGAAAGDIVEFDGALWVATTPTTGMFISADDETTLLYYYGGAAWSTKSFEATTASTGLTKVGFDVRLADAAENASGIKVLSGAITLEDLGAFSTTDLSEGTALYFTEARVRASLLTGADVSTNGSVTAADSVLSAAGKLQANQADLTTLSGVAQGAVDLGTFTGTTIADSQTVKAALQALETALESVPSGSDENVKVSANDTTAKYLEDAIVVSSGTNSSAILEVSTLNDAGDEDLQIQIDEAKINHDALLNFAANEHIDHSTVDIATAVDSGLAGGGDLTATRNLSVDITSTTDLSQQPDGADEILIWDGSASALRKVSITNLLGNSAASPGDIQETTSTIANNQAAAVNVQDLVFANATVRSFKAQVSIVINATANLYEVYDLMGIQKGSSWEMAQVSTGDDSSIVFTITNAGQVQYTSANYAGFVGGNFRIRAQTTSV